MLEIKNKNGTLVRPNNFQHYFELTIDERISWDDAHQIISDIYQILKSEHPDSNVVMFFSIKKIHEELYSVKFQTYIENDDNGTFPTEYLIKKLCVDYELEVFDLTKKETEDFLFKKDGADFGMLANFKPSYDS